MAKNQKCLTNFRESLRY